MIEGGGFKSVFSAGVLDAFLMNKFNPFDIYIGVSSGAMCLSYYVANQYKTYFSLSKEVSVNEKFLSYRHALSEQGYMDLNFLSKYAKEHNPIDLQNIKESTENKELYGSVKPTEISKLILENDKLDIKPSMIQPITEIKSIGKFKVKIILHSEVDSEITINVVTADTIQ